MSFLSSSTRRLPHSLSLLRLISTTHPYDPTIRRLARSGKFSDIDSLLKNNTPSLSQESLITNYTSAGMIDSALPLVLTTQTLNSLLSACNHSPSLFRRVPDLFSHFTTTSSISPDHLSYSILIKSLCRSRQSTKALAVLRQMETDNVETNVVTYTTILDSLYKDEKPARAETLWAEMLARGLQPDAAAYNVRIMHKTRTGKTDEVLRLMEEMAEKGLEHNAITYNYLIQCYCNDKKFEEARKVYEGMECEPNFATYRSYVRELCKNGNVGQAVKVYEDSVKRSMVPDLGTVRVLVEELMGRKKGRAAKRVVTELKHNFAEDFVGGWLELEKLVGLEEGEENSSAVVA